MREGFHEGEALKRGVSSTKLVRWASSRQISLLRWLIPALYLLASLAQGAIVYGRLPFALVLEDLAFSLAVFTIVWLILTPVARSHQEFGEQSLEVISSLISAAEAKDPYAGGHSKSVAHKAVVIAQWMGLPSEEIGTLRVAALLHDIGKIGIPEAILHKPSNLTRTEFKVLESHPQVSVDIIKGLKPFASAMPAILHHHERYDGAGYPEGLRGEEIPLLARVLAVANSIDAMEADRPYRKALTRAEIQVTLEEGAGSQWDSGVVEAALRVLEEDKI